MDFEDDETSEKLVELGEISELILDLEVLLKDNNIPDSIHHTVGLIMNHIALLLVSVCEDNRLKHQQVIEHCNTITELNYVFDELVKENEDLRKFVESVKKFPAFQC